MRALAGYFASITSIASIASVAARCVACTVENLIVFLVSGRAASPQSVTLLLGRQEGSHKMLFSFSIVTEIVLGL